MKTMKIGFLGLGTIGSKLMEYLRANILTIQKEFACNIRIAKVFVRDINKKRSIDTSDLDLTFNPYEVVNESDLIVECLGGNGVELTRKLILSAIDQKKAVIMSSKKCLAMYGKEIMTAVTKNHTVFHYDETVGGGIPISSIFDSMGKCETIQKMYGICNGTSNFILSEMTDHNLSYQDALQKAIQSGYAENNPKEDVDGFDALYKTIIMLGMGMNYWITIKDIEPVTISSIDKLDILKAKRENYIIKPIFYLEKDHDQVTVYIGPKNVSKDSLMATVKENNNIIVIYSSESRERAFYGQGAGAKPSASAMYDDLIKSLKEMNYTKTLAFI